MIRIFRSEVLEIKNPVRDVKFVKLSVPDDFGFAAGQYLSMSIMGKDGKKIRRPFSISNAPIGRNRFVEFCIKIIPGGLASDFVLRLKKKDEVELFGPAGKFIVSDAEKDIFLVAAGVGIAPFMSIIPDLLENKNFRKKIILLKSSRTEEDSLYDAELNKLEKEYPNFRFYNILSNPKNKNESTGHVQDFVEKYIPSKFRGNFYICGMKAMINEVKEKLISLGFEDWQIFCEKFD